MKQLTIIIRPEKVSSVIAALHDIHITGMTITDVRGQGMQKGVTTVYRGVEYKTDFVIKSKIETVVSDQLYERAIELVLDAARTGHIGDGKIFITDISDAIRIRTREHGIDAIS